MDIGTPDIPERRYIFNDAVLDGICGLSGRGEEGPPHAPGNSNGEHRNEKSSREVLIATSHTRGCRWQGGGKHVSGADLELLAKHRRNK